MFLQIYNPHPYRTSVTCNEKPVTIGGATSNFWLFLLVSADEKSDCLEYFSAIKKNRERFFLRLTILSPQFPFSPSAVAVKSSAKHTTAAQHRRISKRSQRAIKLRQSLGSASGCHASAVLLIGTVPKNVTNIHTSKHSKPAHRKPKLIPLPALTIVAIPDRAVETKIAGTSTRNLRMST